MYPQYAQQGAKKEDTDFVYYNSEGGQWKIKVEGARYREGTTEKGKFFMELNKEDAKSAWDRRMEILKKGFRAKDNVLKISWI